MPKTSSGSRAASDGDDSVFKPGAGAGGGALREGYDRGGGGTAAAAAGQTSAAGGRERILSVNVGGVTYTTSQSTLCRYPGSLLADWFTLDGDIVNTPPTDNTGAYFIDRDGHIFRYVLNYLRTGQLSVPKQFSEMEALQAEAKFYQIAPLLQAINMKRKELQRIHDVSLEVSETYRYWADGFTITIRVTGRTCDIDELKAFLVHETKPYDYCPMSQSYDDHVLRTYSWLEINLSQVRYKGSVKMKLSSSISDLRAPTANGHVAHDGITNVHAVAATLPAAIVNLAATGKSGSLSDLRVSAGAEAAARERKGEHDGGGNATPVSTAHSKQLVRQKLGEYLLMSGWRLAAVTTSREVETDEVSVYREKWLHETIQELPMIITIPCQAKGGADISPPGPSKKVEPAPISQTIPWSKFKQKVKNKMKLKKKLPGMNGVKHNDKRYNSTSTINAPT